MEPNYGILSIIPAFIVIGLALWTKKTMLSLIIGTFIGVVILNGGNVLTAFPATFTDFIVPNMVSEGNIKTLIIITVINGFVKMLKVTGAGQSLAQWAKKGIKSKRSAEVITCASGFAFIYTEPNFVLGVVMRSVTEAFNVARVKLAYITDSLGCNMAALSPICSYGPYYTGLIAAEIAALGLSMDAWSVYWKYLPNNLYSLLAILIVYYVAASGKDIGPMYLAEMRADKTGRLMGPNDDPIIKETADEQFDSNQKLPIRNFVIPMATMFIVLFATIFYTGDLATNGIQVFTNADITLSIICGMTAAGLAAMAVGVAEKIFTIGEGFEKWIQGFIVATEVNLILIMAWALSTVSSDLGLKFFIGDIVESTGFSPALIPAIVFLAGCVISFATGSSWGTTALLMPVAVPICYTYGIEIAISAAAAIAGGLFGDHCSPISDTTIKASMAAACDHMQHVSTQIPYAVTAGACSFVAFVVAGFTDNTIIALVVAFALAILAINVQHKMAKKKYANVDFSDEPINPNLVHDTKK